MKNRLLKLLQNAEVCKERVKKVWSLEFLVSSVVRKPMRYALEAGASAHADAADLIINLNPL